MDIDLNELLEKMRSALAEENWQLIEEVIEVLWQHLYIEEANEFVEDNGFWEE